MKSELNDLLCFWLLPSLVALLLWIVGERHEGRPLHYYQPNDWLLALGLSAAYPLVFIAAFARYVWPALVKERHINKT